MVVLQVVLDVAHLVVDGDQVVHRDVRAHLDSETNSGGGGGGGGRGEGYNEGLQSITTECRSTQHLVVFVGSHQ